MGTIERGETNLSLQNLAKLSTALGLTMSDLLSGVEAKAEELAQTPKAGRQKLKSVATLEGKRRAALKKAAALDAARKEELKLVLKLQDDIRRGYEEVDRIRIKEKKP
jgi:hypothetical protein